MAIVTISRGTFSGGKQIAEGVAERLGFRCISMEILIKAAEDFGVPIDKLNDAIRRRPSLFDRLRLEKQHCVTVIKDELVRAVQNEDVVYHGLAGHLMLKELPHVLRVKVVADFESRVQAAMEADSLTHQEAERCIAKVDQERNRWVKYLYHVDRHDYRTYDMVINLERVSIPSAIDVICRLAQEKEFLPTEESHRKMADLVLANDIKAKIAARGDVEDKYLEVTCEDGVVTLGGRVESLVDADRVQEAVTAMPEVKDVIPQLHIMGMH